MLKIQQEYILLITFDNLFKTESNYLNCNIISHNTVFWSIRCIKNIKQIVDCDFMWTDSKELSRMFLKQLVSRFKVLICEVPRGELIGSSSQNRLDRSSTFYTEYKWRVVWMALEEKDVIYSLDCVQSLCVLNVRKALLIRQSMSVYVSLFVYRI